MRYLLRYIKMQIANINFTNASLSIAFSGYNVSIYSNEPAYALFRPIFFVFADLYSLLLCADLVKTNNNLINVLVFFLS